MLEKMSAGTLVIHFADGNKVEISEKIVRESADAYWKGRSVNDIRATMLTRCAFCSKGNDTFCDAVGSIFPVLSFFDGYLSHQPVQIEYWESETRYLTLESTLQVVLEYIVRLSIFEYCDATRRFKEFFSGNILFSENIEEIAEQIRKNVFWTVKGNTKDYKKKLQEIEQVLRITTENKLNRFRILTKGDAFLNALVRYIVPLDTIAIEEDFQDSPEENIENVRVIKIQQEHAGLFALFERMENLVILQEEPKIPISDWVEFSGRLRDHFRSEGQEFDSSNCPYKALHNKKHTELLEYLPLFEQKKTADGILVDFDDLRLLRQSIQDHVEVLDTEMLGYLN